MVGTILITTASLPAPSLGGQFWLSLCRLQAPDISNEAAGLAQHQQQLWQQGKGEASAACGWILC